MAHLKIDFSQLTPEERIQLAEDLWDSLGDLPASAPLSEPQARELDRRLEAYRRDGDPGRPWQPVLDRIEERLRERGG
ncbi:MAG TPA: addiction module protein [Gemmatimonadaceae bacterium]|nr:addiction module protein [Gemmatimonadaceae bacterium]